MHCSAHAVPAEITAATNTRSAMHRAVREQRKLWCLTSTCGHLSEVMARKSELRRPELASPVSMLHCTNLFKS